jgi:sigma-B regulation protein RsbU (phosphoserine phosphatase)
MAARIQSDMMPQKFPAFPERKEFDIYASMTPAKDVGGDFYDFFMTDSDHLCMIIADVSGKGVPASLFMMASKIILKNSAMHGNSVSDILFMTNRAICANNTNDMFVTVWLGILEISTGKLTAANAGHEYPILTGKDGNFSLLKDKHGVVIGAMDMMKYKEYEIQLEKGSNLFVYTDGLPEASDKDNNMFGIERTVETLNKNISASPEVLIDSVSHSVKAFVRDAEQFDDLTMMCIEYRGRE